MGLFSFTQKWSFPSNNYGQINGIADSGVETFKGTPIKSLAREICQNSLDAHRENSEATRIEFKTFDIETKNIPDFNSLVDAFDRSLDFWSRQQSDKAKAFFRNAIKTAKNQRITCLRISDFCTSGLTGSREEYNSAWCNLTKSTGTSDKTGSNGGSFGIGKYAPFACSVFRTVFYSTSDVNSVCAYQGVSRLTSFKNKKGEITQGTGFYGNEKNTPVFEQISLDPDFTRKKTDFGTDIFILGFTGEDDWKDKMVASILDGFLYAVFSGTLIVDVDGIIISKETLPSLVVSHKAYFQEHADEYYQTLVDEKSARTFEKDLTDDAETYGHLSLKMMIMPEFHRRVAMVRQTGMKIKDKGNISGLIPFSGVLFIKGDAINTYLRSLENPQHLEWEIERADNKAKAKRLLALLNKYIKQCLNEMKNDDSEEAIDPSVGEYLSADENSENDNQEMTETITDTIKDIKVKITEVKPKPSDSQTGSEGSTEVDDPEGDISVTDIPGEGGSGSQQSNGGGGNGGGSMPGNGGGDIPIEHRKSLSSIMPASVRSMMRDRRSGEYTIVFTPSTSAQNGVLELFMSAESQNYDAKILEVNCKDCPEVEWSGNKISKLVFTAQTPLRVDIRLDYSDYCSLEVKAYGNKI